MERQLWYQFKALDPFQSIFSADHGGNDTVPRSWYILLVMDNGQVAILTLLDLLTSFDTIAHEVLLAVLQPLVEAHILFSSVGLRR